MKNNYLEKALTNRQKRMLSEYASATGKALPNEEMELRKLCRAIEKRANAFARKAGYWKATDIIFSTDEDKIVSHTRPGYRKITTDQYVPNAYINNFGWKNTYYQGAETTVQLHVEKD